MVARVAPLAPPGGRRDKVLLSRGVCISESFEGKSLMINWAQKMIKWLNHVF